MSAVVPDAGERAALMAALATGTVPGLPGGHFIDGGFRAAASGARMVSFDPGRGVPFADFAAGDAQDIDSAVQSARAALAGPWGRATPAECGRVLQRAAALLRAEAGRFAVVETLDSGKRLSEARGDVASAARAFEYYAGACDKLQGEVIPLDRDHLAYTRVEPVGVCAQIIPWNYPLSTTARGLAPALAAGCTVVVKPAETTPFTALLLADLLTRAGLPAGACNVVTGTGPAAGAPLVAHPQVDHVTFTGSVASGIGVMQAAAPQVTRVLLELGGKSPLVVMADCDVEQALDGAFGAIFENAGQICSAGSRLLIERPLHARFVEALVRRAQALALAHGLRDAGMGPVNSAAQQARIDGHVSRARDRGVTVLCGGHPCADPLTGQGWFYPPTVLDQVPSDDEAVRQEIFGPVLCVQAFDDADEALALANGTDFALVAGVYTRDFALAHRMARDIDAGQVYINEYFAGGIEVPFGGNRQSGFGREKGLEGLRSYCRTKSVAARL